MLLADGFEGAYLGVLQCKGRKDVACYDYNKCVQILVQRDGMSPEEAEEFMDFNVVDAYVGEETPAFLHVGAKPTESEDE